MPFYDQILSGRFEQVVVFSFIVLIVLLFNSYKNYRYQRKEIELSSNSTSNKAILITGCGSGIGKATANKLNKLGFIVIATCRRQESVDNYLNNKTFIQNGSICLQLDVSSYQNILNVKQKIKSFLNQNNFTLWGIVNNAGVACPMLFEFKTHEMIKKNIDVNMVGAMNICHEFIPLLYGRCNKINGYKHANGGRIVNVSSFLATISMSRLIVYSATKAALSHFSHGLRNELSPRFGIWCSTMEIGAFSTNMFNIQKQTDQYDAIMKCMADKNDIKNAYDLKLEKNGTIDWSLQLNQNTNADLNVPVDDIIHSLTAKHPKRTYQSGITTKDRILIWFVRFYYVVHRTFKILFVE